jgi:hypothetical protein
MLCSATAHRGCATTLPLRHDSAATGDAGSSLRLGVSVTAQHDQQGDSRQGEHDRNGAADAAE